MLSKRILELRNTLALTQAEFASKLGMASHTVYKWESDRVAIKDASLILIELTFNVNPKWLRNGVGDMFLPTLIAHCEKIVQWLKSLPEDDQMWAAKEIERHIPEYKSWLNK